jgi:hypothetical protein
MAAPLNTDVERNCLRHVSACNFDITQAERFTLHAYFFFLKSARVPA